MAGNNKFKYGAISAALTALFVAAVVIVNMFAGLLTDRFYLKADLTKNKLFEISDETKNMLSSLSDIITVTVLSREESFDPDLAEILSKYAALSGGTLAVRYIDPYINAAELERYNIGTEPVAVGDVIVESEKRFYVVKYIDLYEIKTDYERNTQYASGINAEQRITSAVMYTIADELPKAMIMAGHGETPCEELSSLLEKANYSVESINLLSGGIPDDCDLLIINAPATDFSADEISKLDAYFDKNGKAMISLSFENPPLSAFERYLEEWGIRYVRSVVFDSQLYITAPINVVGVFMDHDITSQMLDAYAVNLLAMPIDPIWLERGSRSVTPLVVTSTSSYTKTPSAENPLTGYEKMDGDATGPFAVAVLAQELHVENNEPDYSQIIFFNKDLASDNALKSTSAMNRRFFLSAASYLSSFTSSVVVEPRAIESGELSILGWQMSVVFWVIVVLIPLLILAAGVVVWARRRNM